jgi:diguanylate cyclase (GGDEF)-like protein
MDGTRPDTDSKLEKIYAAQMYRVDSREPFIFDNVDLVAVSSLLEQCSIRDIKSGEILLAAGESNRTIFFVLGGTLSVHLESKESEPVAVCSPGQTVGELSVIDGHPTSAYVIAMTDCQLLAMAEETFWGMVQVSHAFAVNLLLFMASRIREKNFTVFQGQALQRKFEHEAMFDALTNLRNRRWLDANFSRMLQRQEMDGKPLSVLMLDIDHFKKFNDTFGHATGDKVLIMVSAVIHELLRPSTPCIRVGGEEFLIIFPETDLTGALIAAERVRVAISKKEVELADGTVLPPITVSIGVAQAVERESEGDIMARADAALYRAKGKGRNRVES